MWGCSSPNECIPDETRSCVCSDGASGKQSCDSDGKWRTCITPTIHPGCGDSCPGIGKPSLCVTFLDAAGKEIKPDKITIKVDQGEGYTTNNACPKGAIVNDRAADYTVVAVWGKETKSKSVHVGFDGCHPIAESFTIQFDAKAP